MRLSDVAVVIVTYNSAADIIETLTTLPLHELHRVVVVDNASSDGTADIVLAARWPNVRVVRSPVNSGFGAGCNAGVQELPDARLLLFLNPDARIDGTSLELLVRCLEQTPSTGLVAPRLRSGGTPITSATRLATLWSEIRYVLPPLIGRLLPDRLLPASYDQTGVVGCVEGACMLVRGDAFRRSGAFDESYFLFFEEHDLARRLARERLDIVLCAEAWADHSVGASRKDLDLGGRAHYIRSAARYIEEWQGPLAGWVYRTIARTSWTVRKRIGRLDPATADSLLSGLRPR